MGWTFVNHRPPGLTHAEFFSNELLRSAADGGTSRIIDSAYMAAEEGSVFYAAIATDSGDQTEIWALVVLTRGCAGAEFGWKEMDETMGPAEDGCPARILDLLSETDNEHALEWRRRCRERIALLESAVEGAVLEFSADFLSPTGAYKQFIVVDPSKDIFEAPDGNTYRLVGWRHSGFRVLERAS